MCRPQSIDLRPFWRGFIELQKKLPIEKPVNQIVVHSWNPELVNLARLVYAPQSELHEQQPCFYPEFIHQIEPPDRFELGLDRSESTWKNVSIQSVLGNARSRARAAQLMDTLPSQAEQVLITRWDLGQSGSTQVNQLVADAALPEEYMYLSYFSEVDEGYADMWVMAPWKLARYFGRFDAFVLDALTGRNRYLERFTEAGWPRARIKTRYETVLSHPLGQRVHAIASKLVRGLQSRFCGDALPQRILRRLTDPMQRFLTKPPLTAENSCVPGAQDAPRIFPSFMALNIHALLKFFIISEDLREKTRFLNHEDFEIATQSGQLINPQPIVLLLWDVDCDTQAVQSLVSESPLPIAAVYQLGDQSVCELTPDGCDDRSVNVLRPVSSAPRDQLATALDAATNRMGGAMPVLIAPSADRYLGCDDWVYLNALVKYIAWSSLGYVGLDCAQRGRPHLEFPDLHLVRGGGAFSLRIAAGTLAGIRMFLDAADPELVDVCDRANRMLLELPVVAKSENLF